MSTTELFITSIVCAFAAGVLLTAASYEWSYRRMRSSVVNYRTQAINARAENDTLSRYRDHHKGTPYIREAPGLRVVGGEARYSSEWLND